MPHKTKTAAADKAAMPRIPAELLAQLIPGPVTPGQFEDIFQQFKRAFIERALGAEMSHHLGYAPGQAKPHGAVNHRNGDRGRDAHYWAPRAQIPACAIHALGSYLGCLTAKRSHGHG